MEGNILDTTLSVDDAKQDKIELDVGEWFIQAIDSEMAGFIQCLGSQDRSQSQSPHRAFQSDNYLSSPAIKRLQILKPKYGRGLLDNAPLFGGYLEVRKITATEQLDSYILKLRLRINPTRFCVYQPTPLRVKHNNKIERILTESFVLFAKQDRISHASERTLDYKDNALLKPVSKLNGSRGLWQQNLERYISSISDYLSNEINEYHSGGFALRGFEPYYSLKSIETYWDIKCDNPVATVKSLERDFLSLGNNTSTSYYNDAGTLTEGSAIALRAEFKTKQRLKLYAKTNKRVRIEIEHKYSQNPALTENRTYTATSLEGLIGLINFASHESFELADKFLASLSEYSNHPTILSGNPLTFIQMIYRHLNDIELAEEISSLLTVSGGVPTGSTKGRYKEAFEKLILPGVIVRKGRPINRYVIAPRFASVKDCLI
ncbi:hypothetical protein ACM9HF_20010 [Colwellia sp. RE-S-Sl-9]